VLPHSAVETLLTFQRNVLPPSSGSKSKASKQQAGVFKEKKYGAYFSAMLVKLTNIILLRKAVGVFSMLAVLAFYHLLGLYCLYVKVTKSECVTKVIINPII
jgi:hypothetical protein